MRSQHSPGSQHQTWLPPVWFHLFLCESGIMPPRNQAVSGCSNRTSPGEEGRFPGECGVGIWTPVLTVDPLRGGNEPPLEEEMNPPQGLYNLATDFDLISFTSSQHVALNTVQDVPPAGSPSCLYNNTPLDSALVFVCPQNWPCIPLSPSLKEYVPRPPNTDSFCPLKVHPLLMPLCKWHNNPQADSLSPADRPWVSCTWWLFIYFF